MSLAFEMFDQSYCSYDVRTVPIWFGRDDQNLIPREACQVSLVVIRTVCH